MKNRKTSLATTIACAAAALLAAAVLSFFLTVKAYAQSQPAETVRVGQLSDIEDGYDASLCGIAYEIEIPAFG